MQQALALLLVLSVSGCAGTPVRKWGLRGVGAASALVLHEGCHVALTTSMGGTARFRGHMLVMNGLSREELRYAAWAGNVCTGLLAEAILQTGIHRKSDLAWGAAAFHAGNAFAYAFVPWGDRKLYLDFGGSDGAWKGAHIGHTSTVALRLWMDREGE